MTRDRSERSSDGRLSPLSPSALVGWALAGFVLGWVVRHTIAWTGRAVPVIGWAQAVALFFVAIVLIAIARSTRASVASPERRPDAQLLVNRLVLARASAIVGAFVAGAYAGYAVSWLGVPSELTGQRIVRSMVASMGAVAMAIAAVLLERACRVSSGDE